MKPEDVEGTVKLPNRWSIMFSATKAGWSDDHPTSIEFHIFEPTAYVDDSDDWDNAMLGGYIKWDGCSNWNQGGFHLCGHARLIDLMNAMSACYHIAGKFMPGAKD